MQTRFLVLTAALALLPLAPTTSLAQGHAHEVKVELVGKYDLAFDMNGQTQASLLTITKKDGKLGGTLTIHEQEVPLSSVELKDNTVTIIAAMPHGPLKLTLTFKSAEKLEGNFALEGMGGGSISGTRKKD